MVSRAARNRNVSTLTGREAAPRAEHRPVADREDPADASEPDESADARQNRQLTELLNELRVALPGVQMMFGFLLAVPFSQRFAGISSTQQSLYYTAFLAAAAASVCFIAPTAFHRIVWQRGAKGRLLGVSNVLAIIGTVFLAAAITAVVLFITSYLYGSSWAALAGGSIVAALVSLWYVLPLAVRLGAYH
jgi:Family of unknown function (DUF6328)